METSLTLKVSELDSTLLEVIKKLFRKDREITLTVRSATDFELNEPETKDEYIHRLQNSLKNLDAGKGVSFNEEELDQFVFDRLKR